MYTSVSRPWRRPAIPFPWLLFGGYAVAALDLAIAIAWWQPQGVSASRILQSFTAWVLGPAAYHGGAASAVLGALLYGNLMWGVFALYHRLAKKHPVLLHRPVACGAVYGAVAYFSIFHCLAPLLSGKAVDYSQVGWIATCVLVFMTLVGIPCALFSRAASGIR